MQTKYIYAGASCRLMCKIRKMNVYRNTVNIIYSSAQIILVFVSYEQDYNYLLCYVVIFLRCTLHSYKYIY